MKRKIIIIVVISTLVVLSTPLVVGKEEQNNAGWKYIVIKGGCNGHGFGGFFNHFFGLWCTPHTLNFDMGAGCEVTIDGEPYPIDWSPDIELHGFIGRAIWPYSWTIKSKQNIEPPYDITVFGFCKHIDIR
jgi:hypothetical protein